VQLTAQAIDDFERVLTVREAASLLQSTGESAVSGNMRVLLYSADV